MARSRGSHTKRFSTLLFFVTFVAPWAASAADGPAALQHDGRCHSPAHHLYQRTPSVDARLHRELAYTVSADIPVPAEFFAPWLVQARLSRLLKGTDNVPAVRSTVALRGKFGAPGSWRLVCLADGGRAIEEVVRYAPPRYFSYVVWGYTSPSAAPVAYGYGEFRIRASGRATRVTWTYSFKLRDDRFPGKLGETGRALFRLTFLEAAYAQFMKESLQTIREEAVAAYAKRSNGRM